MPERHATAVARLPRVSGSVVRVVGAGDADAIARLRLAWAVEKGVEVADAGFGERLASWLAAEAGHRVFWLAEAEGEPIGMVNLMLFERMPYPDTVDFRTSWDYLGNLYVLAPHRGRGVGAALIEACTTYAEEHRMARIVLSPSLASVPLYRRAGFVEADELMVRRLG